MMHTCIDKAKCDHITETHKQLAYQYTAHDFATALGFRIATNINLVIDATQRDDMAEQDRLLQLIVLDMGYMRGFERKVSKNEIVSQLEDQIEKCAQFVEKESIEIRMS